MTIFWKTGLSVWMAGLFFTSCTRAVDVDPAENNTLEVIEAKDLDGNTKEAVYFSLEQKKEVDASSADWDIKFSGTTISFGNGAGGQLAEGILASYGMAPESNYSNSNIGGSGSYYTYTNTTEPQHAVLMKPGVLLIVKTGKGKYAKIEMISYYKGNPDVTTADFADWKAGGIRQTTWPVKYYTFNYVIQSDGTNKF